MDARHCQPKTGCKMLEFILGAAQSVLANVITEFATGRTKKAHPEQIEEIIERQVQQSLDNRREDVRLVVRSVLEEVFIIAEKDPDLMIIRGDITLTPTLRARQDGAELAVRLRTLEETVELRKKEKMLESASEVDEIEYEEAPVKAGPDWRSELREMERRVQERKGG